jgi:hypothetical protein
VAYNFGSGAGAELSDPRRRWCPRTQLLFPNRSYFSGTRICDTSVPIWRPVNTVKRGLCPAACSRRPLGDGRLSAADPPGVPTYRHRGLDHEQQRRPAPRDQQHCRPQTTHATETVCHHVAVPAIRDGATVMDTVCGNAGPADDEAGRGTLARLAHEATKAP